MHVTVYKTLYSSFNKLIPLLKDYSVEISVKNHKFANFPGAVIEINSNHICIILNRIGATNTIVDFKNFKNQLEQIMDYFPFCAILIHDYDTLLQSLNPKVKLAFEGLLILLNIKYHNTVLPTQTFQDAIDAIISLTKRIQVKDEPPKFSRHTRKISTLKKSQQELIEGLYNTGPKKAKYLLKVFQIPSKIIADLTPPDTLNQIDNPSIRDLKGFGPIYLKKNQRLLHTIFRQEE